MPSPGRYDFLRVTVDVEPTAFAQLGDGACLVLRNFRRGDLVRTNKLKDLLIDRKIPRPERRWLPLLVRQSDVPPERGGRVDELVWVPGVFGHGCSMSALTQGSRVQ